TNFKRPFFANSVQSFWQRWHISLTSWFKDYIYIPMGGNKVPKWRWYFNIFAIFFISGLWHGAAWTFVVFGALHGIYLVIPLMLKPILDKIPNLPIIRDIPRIYNSFKIVLTVSLFGFSLVFFRSLTFADSIDIFSKLWHLDGKIFIGNLGTFVYSIVAILFLFFVELEQEYKIFNFSLLNNKHYLIRHLSYVSAVMILLLFGVFGGGQFIYFQF
nr:MBOAT family protein [Candidatus Cloacimonadota bacterium]